MSNSVMRGVVAGIIAAIAFAAWILIVDVVKQQPLASLAYMSGLLFSFTTALPATARLAAFMLFHIIVFAAIGAALSRVVPRAPRLHWVPMGLVLGLVLTGLMYAASLLIFRVDVIQGIGWPHALTANAIAGLILASALRARGDRAGALRRDSRAEPSYKR